LQQKLEKLLAFHASSPKIFAPVAELEALVNQGASQASGPEQKVVVPFQKTYNGRPPFPKSGSYEQKRLGNKNKPFMKRESKS